MVDNYKLDRLANASKCIISILFPYIDQSLYSSLKFIILNLMYAGHRLVRLVS